MVKMRGKDVEWDDPPAGDFLTDVKIKVLWQDEKTGAHFRLIKIPKGGQWEIRHKHPNAGQWIFNLSGEVLYPSGRRPTFGEGNYFFSYVPKGKAHGQPKGSTVKIIKDVIVYQYYDGPATRVNVEE